MCKHIRFVILFFGLISQTALAQGWLGKDLSNINVKDLTNSQRDEVLRVVDELNAETALIAIVHIEDDMRRWRGRRSGRRG